MRRLALLVLAPIALASAAQAQPAEPHAHHQHAPAQPAPAQPVLQTADPHAGHAEPTQLSDPHAGHALPGQAAAPAPGTPPPIPNDWEADRHYGRQAMDAAREVLRREHGDVRWSKVMIERLEARPGPGRDAYFWEASASFGGDINRFVLRSEGEGADELEAAEFRALASRAISPWFNLQAGLRQDVEPRSRTYASVGVEGLAPYFFGVEAALFLSDEGDLTARFEGALDWRLTQRLILESRAELNLAAQDVPDLDLGSGLSSLELGLRLRYELTPAFAPYVGAHYERSFGDTARLLRAAQETRSDTRLVLGLRAGF